MEQKEPMATMTVSLPEPMKAWVERQAKSGQYGNASDYVWELTRRDQDRKEAVALLQRAITAGVESGVAEPFDATSFKRHMRQRHVVG